MNTLLKINDQLLNAPAGVLVILFAIALGYILKISAFFPNNRIPLAVVLACAVVFPVLLFAVDKAEANIPRNIILGFILGFIAWTFHAQILKRWIDPKFFDENNDQPKP